MATWEPEREEGGVKEEGGRELEGQQTDTNSCTRDSRARQLAQQGKERAAGGAATVSVCRVRTRRLTGVAAVRVYQSVEAELLPRVARRDAAHLTKGGGTQHSPLNLDT